MVFKRRARHTQTVGGLQFAQRPGGAAAHVLHHLRFVEHDEVPADFLQLGHVAPKQRVGGEHEVVVLNFGELFGAAAALQGEHTQSWRDAGRFVLPVGDQGGGQYDQVRLQFTASTFVERCFFQALFFQQQVRQYLGCFPKAHVVGQDTRQVLSTQVLQPSHALQLVGPQLELQACGIQHVLRDFGRGAGLA